MQMTKQTINKQTMCCYHGDDYNDHMTQPGDGAHMRAYGQESIRPAFPIGMSWMVCCQMCEMQMVAANLL